MPKMQKIQQNYQLHIVMNVICAMVLIILRFILIIAVLIKKITRYNFADGQGKTIFYIDSSGLHV